MQRDARTMEKFNSIPYVSIEMGFDCCRDGGTIGRGVRVIAEVDFPAADCSRRGIV